MISWLLLVLRGLTGTARSREYLAAENAILRHQLSVLQRERPRPFLEARPHQGIQGIQGCGPGSPRTPSSTSGESPIKGVARPVLGGLHHHYRLAA